MLFRDRSDAGRRLGSQLKKFAGQDVVVLALPRGGVPVGFEVALALHAPLDVLVVRKLGAPGHEELALGAVASGDVCVWNWEAVDALGVTLPQMDLLIEKGVREMEEREYHYRGNRERVDVRGKIAIIVDDGLATGSTMRAAVAALRRLGPKKIVVAAPVAAHSTCAELQEEADETVCLYTPLQFYAVGQWYRDFAQTTDEQVRELLDQAAQGMRRPAA
jgi:putative phosphoribosyl transferase